MSDSLRTLNPDGIAAFAAYLQALRDGSSDAPPFHLLNDAVTSEALDADVLVESKTFSNTFEFGTYLAATLGDLPRTEITFNHALWSWLALYYSTRSAPLSTVSATYWRKRFTFFPQPTTTANTIAILFVRPGWPWTEMVCTRRCCSLTGAEASAVTSSNNWRPVRQSSETRLSSRGPTSFISTLRQNSRNVALAAKAQALLVVWFHSYSRSI